MTRKRQNVSPGNVAIPQKTSRALNAARKPVIDYPLEKETLESPSYTIRVAANDARLVRIAINQGPWLECRPAAGYWWFDWSGYAPGEYELVACADHRDGREYVSTPAHCFVK